MKTIVALFFFALVAYAAAQAYNYGYNTYTPGARVSHYQSSSGAWPVVASHPYAYSYGAAHGAAYPGRWW
ncbi:hypothetical protein JTE90_006855 [Oedothorax gibbosus]|uniref:Uncharacterized protein n=1 Tax=Oedothorax gibbosus TaxID=931172 RepID=A0AAV6TVT7_9ARAC|nr:hypothetical protein JTE90_006855 [Oedothorax gibbosus]